MEIIHRRVLNTDIKRPLHKTELGRTMYWDGKSESLASLLTPAEIAEFEKVLREYAPASAVNQNASST